MSTIKLILSVMICLLVAPLTAQFNIKIGYDLGYTLAKVDNRIISEYNTANTSLSDPMKGLHLLNGLLLGGRQRIDDIAICAAYETKFSKLESAGLDSLTNNSNFRNLHFRYQSFSVGLETYPTEQLVVGFSFDLDNIRYRAQTDNDAQRFTVVKNWGYGSTFYAGVNLEGTETLTLSIQPYIQVPWTSANAHPLEQYLIPDAAATTNPDDYKTRYLNFGIKFILYNGYFN